MRQLFTLVTALAVCFSARPMVAYGQVYHLASQEGKPVAIRLSYKLFSKRLAVACAGDTLFLRDYQGTVSVRLLKQRFLQIIYQTRCGTGCSIQNTAVVSLRQQKLQLSLLILSGADSEDFTPGNERAYHYNTALAMAGGSANPYTIQARVHVEETFQSNPGQNRRQNQQVTLHWDSARQIFHSGFEFTARCLPVYDEATKNPFKLYDITAFYLVQSDVFPVSLRWPAAILPVARLGNELNYFIQDEWFAGQEKPSLRLGTVSWFTKNEVEYVLKRQHGLWF
jgi:hypothetical protein